MSLLKPATNSMAYLKMGIFGDTGSGKTWTAAEVAIGLHKFIISKKPVAFFDTETGSGFVLPKFKKSNVELFVHHGTSLADLSQVIDEAEKVCDILIIDSITNVWDEFTDAYMKKRKQNYIELWDWKPLKKEWRHSFRDKFVNSKLHVIMCGREGAIYTSEEQERNGKVKTVTVKSGTKMRAEGDTGYEPSLLCEMVKVFLDGDGTYARRCNVVKERYGLIDSQTFDNPTFQNFMPHIEALNLGGEHVGTSVSRGSDTLFDDDGNGEYYRLQRRRDIAIEELQALLIKVGLDGTSTDAKKGRVEALESVFGTSAKTALESLHPDKLEAGIKDLKVRLLGEKKSEDDKGSESASDDIRM